MKAYPTPVFQCTLTRLAVLAFGLAVSTGTGVSASRAQESPPTVTVTGFAEAKVVIRLAFGKDFERNGSVAAITSSPATGR